MSDKLDVTAGDVAIAAYQGWMALLAELIRKNVISVDDGNAIAATAASMCQAQGSPNAAEVIFRSIPTSRNVDPVGRALDVGMTIDRKAE